MTTLAASPLRPAPPAEAVDGACAHCGSALGPGAVDGFCCMGCRSVSALLARSGLTRFYDLGGRSGGPVALADASRRDLGWIEPLAQSVSGAGGTTRISLDAQGMHCAGCVWVMSEVFERRDGAVRIVADPTLGRLDLWVDPGFDVAGFVRDIEPFGYLLGPALKRSEPALDGLLVRTGVAAALAANAMMFAIAIYVGLGEGDGALFATVRTLELALAIGAVGVAAPVFVRSSIAGLRAGLLHLDLPIALGMILALAGSVWGYLVRPEASYGDSVAVFAALMLLGRWLSERAITRSRDRLLASEGADGLYARRLEGSSVTRVRASELREGDRLLVAPGEVLPVDATLASEGAEVSLDWIDGEAAPRAYERGARVPAGAFNVSMQAFEARAATAWAASPLPELLGRPSVSEPEARGGSRFWDRVARVYVAAVLALSTLAFVAWWLASGDLGRALEVTVAVLVVTCPCGIGIASPLAYRLAAARLRKAGLFLRRERALDRATQVDEVVLDKTGTLTTGAPELTSPSALEGLAAADRAALADLVARSAHPKSLAIRQALGDTIAVRAESVVREVPGAGLEAVIEGVGYRLGAPRWACPERETSADLVLAKDGALVIELPTREALRVDAREEIAALVGAGYPVSLLSGDAAPRVREVGATLGLAPERCIGGARPDDKAAFLASRPRALFVGDGINDGPAAEGAFVSGTPAVDRPFLPARTDFFFVTPGLAPIRALLETGALLARVVRRNLALTVAYNALAVGLAIAGLVEPWVAAVLMPASSIVVIAATTYGMREGRS